MIKTYRIILFSTAHGSYDQTSHVSLAKIINLFLISYQLNIFILYKY